jgi:hypothetical protein
MMGHRERLIDGDEYDALTAAGKRVHRWRAGQRTSAKRSVSRRARRKAKARIIEMEGGAAKADAAQQEAPRRGPPSSRHSRPADHPPPALCPPMHP